MRWKGAVTALVTSPEVASVRRSYPLSNVWSGNHISSQGTPSQRAVVGGVVLIGQTAFQQCIVVRFHDSYCGRCGYPCSCTGLWFWSLSSPVGLIPPPSRCRAADGERQAAGFHHIWTLQPGCHPVLVALPDDISMITFWRKRHLTQTTWEASQFCREQRVRQSSYHHRAHCGAPASTKSVLTCKLCSPRLMSSVERTLTV